MTSSARKEKRHSRIRQEVILVAERLLKKEGVEALTIRGIAKLLDYSPAALYEYFPSKEQIVFALRENIFKKQIKLIRKVDSELPPEVYFQDICVEMLHFRLMPENYWIMTLPLSKELLKEQVPKGLLELRQLLDLALQRLNLPQLATAPQRQLAIFTLRSYLEGVAHLVSRGEMPAELNSPEDNTKRVLQLLLHGWSKK
jgi:AcrR family transcriptional regulator